MARRRGEAVAEAGYQGEYVTELAAQLRRARRSVEAAEAMGGATGSSTRSAPLWRRLGIVFDKWYSQASVEESGALARRSTCSPTKGLVYEQDGATWFRS